jgi:hypothetical protein
MQHTATTEASSPYFQRGSSEDSAPPLPLRLRRRPQPDWCGGWRRRRGRVVLLASLEISRRCVRELAQDPRGVQVGCRYGGPSEYMLRVGARWVGKELNVWQKRSPNLSVRKVVPTLTSTNTEIYLSMAGAKLSFILVPAGVVRRAGVCSRHCIALHRGACRGELQARRERRRRPQVPRV